MSLPNPEGQHRIAKAFADAPPSRERPERRRRQLAEQLKPSQELDGLRHLQACIDDGTATASPGQTIEDHHYRQLTGTGELVETK